MECNTQWHAVGGGHCGLGGPLSFLTALESGVGLGKLQARASRRVTFAGWLSKLLDLIGHFLQRLHGVTCL